VPRYPMAPHHWRRSCCSARRRARTSEPSA
jgi:hypothetical protein